MVVLKRSYLLMFVAAFLTLFANFAFFRNLYQAFSGLDYWPLKIGALALVLFGLQLLALSLFALGKAIKPVLALALLVAAFAAYFMDSYNVVIDTSMLDNVLQTQTAEVRDLLSLKMLGYVLLLGVLPIWAVWRVELQPLGWKAALKQRVLLIGLALLVTAGAIGSSSGFFASFVREHKVLRFYTNPLTPLYSAVRYAKMRWTPNKPKELGRVGEDAALPKGDDDRELIVLVVGETARADHFSLNGYERETNPQLAKEDVISFGQVSSCGTSTAVSVPCMFSFLGRDGYQTDKAESTENILDVLRRAGVTVLWRDNNSSSKGVADRVEYQDFKSAELNPMCDDECRDPGMLVGLDEWLAKQTSNDILIVLHQMGSHGPAYHLRYPPEFARFTPTCDTGQLDQCSQQDIINAYDNSILYTDYFLAEVIQWLKGHSREFETAMLYFSDHGESLGEGGVYLHGLPYLFAPDAQTQVPAVLWMGPAITGLDRQAIRARKDRPYSHDNLIHTLLGLFEVETDAYDPAKDILEYTDTEPWHQRQSELKKKLQ